MRVQTAFTLLLLLTITGTALARGGTSPVASQGQPAYIPDGWPADVEPLVNDPTRTIGLNSYFSGWPNDVNQYLYDVKSTEDINRLIKNLASIKTPLKQIRLCYLEQPQHLGWVTQAPNDHNTAVVFTIGDQSRIDQWYKQVRKPFGVMEFTAAPVAIPPTLTLFVQNESVELDKLEIPETISVSAGYVPTVFHRSNTTLEKAQIEAAKKPNAKPAKKQKKLAAADQKVADQIAKFMEQRQQDIDPAK
ncbi:MAG: hypothetical protein COA78_28590 [Blastopirellula sp.]|nr:MAG: hypothetical protein COA78_28590 [Blastopirellula sp.]